MVSILGDRTHKNDRRGGVTPPDYYRFHRTYITSISTHGTISPEMTEYEAQSRMNVLQTDKISF